jgi:nitroimidazol reductase NimA-like FMN-containing flavoprotein (pyridoxamine 5'-phosphate oxidase superfamily)
VRSVVVFGRAELIEDPEVTAEKARAFGAKYFPTRQELEYELAHALPRVQMVRIRPEAVTGKLVHEK